MKHIKVPTPFIKKNTDTLNTGNHAEAAIQYKNQKRARINLILRFIRNSFDLKFDCFP